MSGNKTPCAQIPCKKSPCRPKPGQPGSAPCEDPNANLKGRPILYTGVIWIGLVRRFLIPRTCVKCPPNSQEPSSRRAPVQQWPEQEGPGTPESVSSVTHLSPNPIIEPPLTEVIQPLPGKTLAPVSTEPEVEEPKQQIGDFIPEISLKGPYPQSREYLGSPLSTLVVQAQEVSALAAEHAKSISEEVTTLFRESKETTSGLVETVRSEDGQVYRIAAITTSGMIGFLAGIRHGILTRLLSSATGVVAMASICYPEEAKAYNRQGIIKVRRWVVLGLSSAAGGPKKPIGSGNVPERGFKISTNDNEFEENVSNVESEQESKPSAGNGFSGIVQNLGEKFGEVKDKLRESFTSTDLSIFSLKSGINEVNEEISNDKSEHSVGSHESTDDSLSDHDVESSSDGTNDNETILYPDGVPYSPALPILPGNKHKQNKQTIPFGKPSASLEISSEDETYINKTKSKKDLFQNAINEFIDTENDEENEESNSEEETDELEDEFSDNIIVIPTGGLDEKLGETFKKTNYRKSENAPLNKKLCSHYKDIPVQKKTSREIGYDDAYSNRG